MSTNCLNPNIVFILSDDHGAWAMGCAGNKEIRTPNLDRLAQEGMRFDNFFCASPVCSPARASILTGRIPSQHGVHDWLSDGNVGDNTIEFLKGQTSYTKLLSENGFNCGISGKWHLGDSIRPQAGFSHWYVHQSGGGNYYNAPMVKDGKLINEPVYITDKITDDALNFLNRHAQHQQGQTPFYLSVHYTAPHSPWINNHPKEIIDSYDSCLFESCPQEPLHPECNELTKNVQKNIRENLKGYFAAVTAMDDNIGRILDYLDKNGIRQNTLVIYMGDNGFNCGHHGFWGKGNGTFPLNMFDTSVKVPAIMSHPGIIPHGVICESLVSQYDFMPTLLDYVGLNNPEGDKLPGKSFLPLLRGQTVQERENVVVYDEYGPVRMIRSKELKYVHRYPYGPHELYDLVHDPSEKVNLIDNPDKQQDVVSMKSKLEEWFVKYTDVSLDGIREPVTGKGQNGLAGITGRGVPTYNPLSG